MQFFFFHIFLWKEEVWSLLYHLQSFVYTVLAMHTTGIDNLAKKHVVCMYICICYSFVSVLNVGCFSYVIGICNDGGY
jgi:hypothetical protein